MVQCVVVGCSSRSERDKDVSFYRIPSIRNGRSQREHELSTKRRVGWLAAISRDDLTEYCLEEGRVCSRHFISGKPASLFDELSPDWLPTQNLGHSKVCEDKVQLSQARYWRSKARLERQSNSKKSKNVSKKRKSVCEMQGSTGEV